MSLLGLLFITVQVRGLNPLLTDSLGSTCGHALVQKDARLQVNPYLENNGSSVLRVADIAIGLISGRPDYDGPLHRAVLQFTPSAVLLKASQKCLCNMRAGMVTLRAVHPDAKWYYIGDEDVFLNLRRMVGYLSQYDASIPTLITAKTSHKHHTITKRCGVHRSPIRNNQMMTYGGTGHIISNAMAKRVRWDRPCNDCRKAEHADGDLFCLIVDHWEDNFRFEYIKHVTRDATVQNVLKKKLVVGHHMTPQQLKLLVGVNQGKGYKLKAVSIAKNDGCPTNVTMSARKLDSMKAWENCHPGVPFGI